MILKLLLSLPVVMLAQDGLTLSEAVRTAISQHPAMEAAASRIQSADARIAQARSGQLPKINYSESYQRSNNPVFVFSSLLAQRRFTESNFAIDSLNNPASVNNFQSQLSAEQPLYDAGVAKRQVESARLQKQLTGEEKRQMESNLAAATARAYFGVLLAEEALKFAGEAVTSSQADLERARNVRSAGLSTDADVLSIEVHLAAMKEQEIRRRSELDVARAVLNESLGAPLDTPRRLTTGLLALEPIATKREDYEQRAVKERSETRQAELGVQLATTQSSMARTAYLPQISLRGVLEADRGRFVTEAGGNWFAAVTLRWNLFNGYADRSKIQESQFALATSKSQQRQVQNGVQLQVRQAHAQFTAASERIQVAQAAIAQADESVRIIRNRYESGLSTVTDLLRNQVAALEARLRRLMAVHDQRVAAAMLEFAAGTLTSESEVLR
jgi:outer membrane protein TolC